MCDHDEENGIVYEQGELIHPDDLPYIDPACVDDDGRAACDIRCDDMG